MALPAGISAGLADSPLDLISNRTTLRDHCPKSFGMTGILGTWAVLVKTRCGQWSCPVCGEAKAQRYAGIARAGCSAATERIRLLTISCPGGETPAESWLVLGRRWGRMSDRLARHLGRRLSYFGTVELQKRGNPHLHLLLRDSGYIPKAVIHAAGFGSGFGFSDIRQIAPGSGVQYVTKYLHKSAGQEMPRGVRRIRRSRDWHQETVAITCKWGPEWAWQSVEHLDESLVVRQLVQAGYTVLHYEQRVSLAADD